MFVIVNVRTAGDALGRTAYGRSTPAERSSISSRPTWYEAANRAAAKALAGSGAGFDSLATPSLVDQDQIGSGYWQAAALDRRGSVIGTAMIAVRKTAPWRGRGR